MSSSATKTTSDNKKKEELEDCRCSGAAVDAAGSCVGQQQQQQQQHHQQQKQQLNVFESNSKKQTSTFGANLKAAVKTTLDVNEAANIKEKELEGAHAQALEAGDSGFISGPQTHVFSEEDEGAVGGGGGGVQKFNIIEKSYQSQQQQQQPPHNKEVEKIILDSGCIDEDFSEDDYEVSTNEEKRQSSEQQQQVQHERSNVAVVISSSNGNTNNNNTATSTADQMILKQNVDAGMSEWFCNLSLDADAPPRPQQHSQQVTGGINNLNSIGRRSATSGTLSAPLAGPNTISFYQNPNTTTKQQQQQQQAAGNSANTTTPTTSNLTPSNAWEKFYQQNDEGDTPLHLACISGYVDVVSALIRMAPHPCLFNIQNDDAQTPLHLAALTAQPKILRMLLIAGAEPTIRDRHGNTALHLVCNSGEEQCVRALTIPISASEINEAHRLFGHRSYDKTVSYLNCARLPSDLEILNYDGEKCVHLAAQYGYVDILRILVLYGADVNAREGKSGRTPLHIAIECCNDDVSNYLLEECQKLNVETATYAGLTAYQIACILNKSHVQHLLEKRGAELLTPPDSDYDSSDIETDLEDSKLYDRFGDPGYFANYNGGNPMTVA